MYVIFDVMDEIKKCLQYESNSTDFLRLGNVRSGYFWSLNSTVSQWI